MAPLDQKNKKLTTLEIYNDHYGNFYEDPSKIADNIFNKNFER
jgi:hypothetical protein